MTDVQNCALKSDGCSVYDEEFQHLHRCPLSNKSSDSLEAVYLKAMQVESTLTAASQQCKSKSGQQESWFQ